ncbi:MAG: hypothetical protein QM809_18830 [Gordonia sp. (in: high G+C Gram-positive bacteria)]|uniref:hypothetical protein n=1 Tax=Gordonia sp. (in: high G+C Gram-positive bacteria) TaxID=84139 RepID=UPI0039E63414
MAVAIVGSTFAAGGAAQALPRLHDVVPGLPNGSLGVPVMPALPIPPAVPKAELDESFQRLTGSMAASLPGAVGIAITPVGGDVPISFGNLKTARAWSTMKVPVAIAAQRARGSAVTAQEIRAIEASDNAAAEALWRAVGGGRKSVDGVEAVLREAHDGRTRVASDQDRPRSYPGYTRWALTDQSIFAAHLPCLPDGADVLDYMAHTDKNQRWGVSNPKSPGVTAAVKGGWGPVSNTDGRQVVRQLAVVTTPRGAYGVSIAATPKSGSFGDGAAMVSRVGRWWLRNIDEFPAGVCGPLG